MAAAARGRLEVVERLLEAGADPGHKNKWGQGAEDWSQWPNNTAEIEARLRSRAQDNDEVIAGRMARARDEISHWAEYDYVLINDDLATCHSRIGTIIAAERQRRDRQTWLQPHVDALYAEFEAKVEDPRE
ncbi:MAG: hypothetical protein IH786_06990 [Proteobacteria bacterium]|nr:hypothetical protein [Pseudomonadota bacterium]